MPYVVSMLNFDAIPTAEVASLLGRDVRTVHRLVAAKRLNPVAKAPGVRGAYLFNRREVERFAAAEDAA